MILCIFNIIIMTRKLGVIFVILSLSTNITFAKNQRDKDAAKSTELY